MNIIERSSHPSLTQIEALMEFLEKNPNLAQGYSKTQCARVRARQQWDQLTLHLNGISGAFKSSKQWTKYWADKKSSVKKKFAARTVAQRKGSAVETVELSEVEERIVTLLGGDRFSTGDAHLGIQPFEDLPSSRGSSQDERKENDRTEDAVIPQHCNSASEEVMYYYAIVKESPSSSPQEETQEIGTSEEPQQPDEPHVQLPRREIGKRLFVITEEDLTAPVTSKSSSIRDPLSLGRRPTTRPSPYASPNTRPSRSPSPANRPSPSPSPKTRPSPLAMPKSPSYRRRSPSPTVTTRHRATRKARTSRDAGSTSRHYATRSAPFSQRRSEFSQMVERFLRVEEQQLELQRSNARLMEALFERSYDRERRLMETVTAMGERMAERDRLVAGLVNQGLKNLADALKRN